MDNKLNMVLNNKDLVLDSIELSDIADVKGTIGFGINGLVAEFSDIEMDCLFADEFSI